MALNSHSTQKILKLPFHMYTALLCFLAFFDHAHHQLQQSDQKI